MNDWLTDQKREVLEGIEKIRGLSNAREIAVFTDTVRSQHRTHQQNLMRMFMGMIKVWADEYDRGRYDARNEETCEFARKIQNLVEDNRTYFPFI
jgi:hypothetical protein